MSTAAISFVHPPWELHIPEDEISKAYQLFLGNPLSKIYYGADRVHSIRPINDHTFAVQLNRKSHSPIGKGASKKAVEVWQVTMLSGESIEIVRRVLVKENGDISDLKGPGKIREIASRALRDQIISAPHVEHVEEHHYATKSGYLRQFYVTEKAACNASEIATHTACTSDNFLELCVELVLGVDELHERGVVHGDLSPTNMLIFRDRETMRYHLKVADLDTIRIPTSTLNPSTQNGWYLCPVQRKCLHLAFEAFYKKKPGFLRELDEAYCTNKELRGFYSHPETEIISVGLVLASLCFDMKKANRIHKPALETLWGIIKDLTGGYAPSSTIHDMPHFLCEIDNTLMLSHPRKSRLSLKEAASRIASLQNAK